MSSDRRYSQEEVDAILKRALERDGGNASEALTHQDLIATAREVGIEPAQVEAAIAEVGREKQAVALREAWLEKRRTRLRKSLTSWLLASTVCFVINLLTGASGGWWFLWVLVPWGAALAVQFARLSRGPSQDELLQLQRQIERDQRKQQLEARFERGAKVLEAVVEQGANLLLAHIDERAKRLEAAPRDDAGDSKPKR